MGNVFAGFMKGMRELADHLPIAEQGLKAHFNNFKESVSGFLADIPDELEQCQEEMEQQRSQLSGRLMNVQIDYDACVNELWKARSILNKNNLDVNNEN